jgi:hypothetical protein
MELPGQKGVKKIAFVFDESRIETDCPDGCSRLKGPSDAAKAFLRGSTDQICGLQVDEQMGSSMRVTCFPLSTTPTMCEHDGRMPRYN